ncbi:MAG: hypothetical protein Q9214_005855 [Letrouitia sp. 1 TL-2023]
MVLLHVGFFKEKFYVHKNILCEASDFFDNALKSEFQEGQKQEIVLPEDTAATFNALVNWLYCPTYTLGETEMVNDSFNLYYLADKYVITALKNQIIDTLFLRLRKDGNSIHAMHLHKVWQQTPTNSGLRRLLTDTFVWTSELSYYFESDVFYAWLVMNPETAADFTRAFAMRIKYPMVTSPFTRLSSKHYYDDRMT